VGKSSLLQCRSAAAQGDRQPRIRGTTSRQRSHTTIERDGKPGNCLTPPARRRQQCQLRPPNTFRHHPRSKAGNAANVCAGDRRPRRRQTEQGISALPAHREDGRACVGGVTSGLHRKRQPNTMPGRMEKSCGAKPISFDWAPMLFHTPPSAASGWRSIFALPLLAVEQHRRPGYHLVVTKCCRRRLTGLAPPSRAGARTPSTTAPGWPPRPPSLQSCS